MDWYAFLQRPPLPSPSAESLATLRAQSILVTGAGGSIGSALSLRLAQIAPRRLILLDSSEQSLYRLQRRLAEAQAPGPVTVLGSVSDSSLLDEIWDRHQPSLVFHAAAHKHAPLLEEQPLAAIATNTLATLILSDSMRRHGVDRMILLSTDKAVEPTNILGATKHIAEQITLAAGGIAIRLANVLGSEGSVAESFQQQIQDRRPVTITHPHADRLFLTSTETVDLLLIAATSAEASTLLIPKLDRAHSITDLARFLAATLAPARPFDHVVTGLRAGDKLHESLFSAEERSVATDMDAFLKVVQSSSPPSNLTRLVSRLAQATQERDLVRAIEVVLELVPTYQPSEVIHSLVDQSRAGVGLP